MSKGTKKRPAAGAAGRATRATFKTSRSGKAGGKSGSPVRLPREPKGRRAQFYADPAIDQLMAIVAALTAEVSVAFERMDTLERLLEGSAQLDRAAIEAFLPDEAVAAERFRAREELIERVFQVLGQYERRG